MRTSKFSLGVAFFFSFEYSGISIRIILNNLNAVLMEVNNQNVNNVTVKVQIGPPKKKVIKKKKEPSYYKRWILGIVGTIIATISIPYVTNGINSLFRDNKDTKILKVLTQYADDLNKNSFDANKYFSSNVERFYQMRNTSPQEINDYVHGEYLQQYRNCTMNFDESTMEAEKKENGEYKASVIMYSTGFDVAKQKQFDNLRTRIELILDKDFRIKFLRQFYN